TGGNRRRKGNREQGTGNRRIRVHDYGWARRTARSESHFYFCWQPFQSLWSNGIVCALIIGRIAWHAPAILPRKDIISPASPVSAPAPSARFRIWRATNNRASDCWQFIPCSILAVTIFS